MSSGGKLRVELDRLVNARQFEQARLVAAEALRTRPRDAEAWLGIARSAVGMNRLRVAEQALGRSEGVLRHDHRWLYAAAFVDHYVGRSGRAVDRLRLLIDRNAPNALDAHIFLADILHRMGRHDEFRAFVRAGGAWTLELRGRIVAARSMAESDPERAAAELEQIFRGPGDVAQRRNAGFAAVAIHDRMGRHRPAWDLATVIHAETSAPYDTLGLVEGLREQLQLLGRGKPWFEPRVPPVEGVGFIIGMPRSGTTLIEQMLDRHSQVIGIGEYEGIWVAGETLKVHGAWCRGLGSLDAPTARGIQDLYIEGSRTVGAEDAKWRIDKSLQTWRLLPAVAAILPGARCIHVARDPRDTAVSLFLSNFHHRHSSWTRSLAEIVQVMAAERDLSLTALDALGIPHEAIVYEDLVEDVEGHARRVARLLEIEEEPAMLSPEHNPRTVLTLSHAQVRRPVNRSSIGRWRNYEWAFGPEWDALVARHDARRTPARTDA
jgi:tetratricopeptide (TPR) repeat protein